MPICLAGAARGMVISFPEEVNSRGKFSLVLNLPIRIVLLGWPKVRVFPLDRAEKPERTFWPTRYIEESSA